MAKQLKPRVIQGAYPLGKQLWFASCEWEATARQLLQAHGVKV